MSDSQDSSAGGNGFHPATAALTQTDAELLRQEMVERQLRKRGIRDERVLAAMLNVPRHEFVPPSLAAEAYTDRPLPIGHGQTISQPFMVAAMAEALELSGGERVLEIGAGSGYQAAVLSLLAREVHTVEMHEDLATSTRRAAAAPGLRQRARARRRRDSGMARRGSLRGHCGHRGSARTFRRPSTAQLAEGGRLLFPWEPPDEQRLLRRG